MSFKNQRLVIIQIWWHNGRAAGWVFSSYSFGLSFKRWLLLCARPCPGYCGHSNERNLSPGAHALSGKKNNSLPEDKCGEGKGSWEGEHRGLRESSTQSFMLPQWMHWGHVLRNVPCNKSAHTQAEMLWSTAHQGSAVQPITPSLLAGTARHRTTQQETKSSTRDSVNTTYVRGLLASQAHCCTENVCVSRETCV